MENHNFFNIINNSYILFYIKILYKIYCLYLFLILLIIYIIDYFIVFNLRYYSVLLKNQ